MGDIFNKDNFEIYKNTFEYAHDIIFILTSDGWIIDANKEAVKAYGYSYEELLKKNIFEFRDPIISKLAQNQFEVAKFKGIEFETLHFKKDGTSFPVEVKSIGTNDKNSNYIISIVRDITNRIAKTKEIERLANIVESSDDCILGVSPEGTIINWNKGAERMFGYLKPEIIGKHFSILVPEGNPDDIYVILDKVKNGVKFDHYETTRRCKDGKILRVLVSISPIYNSEGIFQGTSAIARDITEKTNLIKKLNEHEKRWKLANELLIANTFQTSLMSKKMRFGTTEVYGSYIPSSMVGGDLYDCIASENSLWFIIADVTGHGLVAAMVSTMIKGMFRNCIHNCTYPNEVLENLNIVFCNMFGECSEYLASAFIGVIRENTLYYSNGGHPYPIIIESKTKNVNILSQNGYLLSMLKNVKYDLEKIQISDGTKILLYSDGLINLRNETRLCLWDRIREHIYNNLNLIETDAESYIELLINSFQYDYGNVFDDDVSIMLISKF